MDENDMLTMAEGQEDEGALPEDEEQEQAPDSGEDPAAMRAQIKELQFRLACAKEGIPDEIAGDIYCIAEKRSECPDGQAAKEIFERLRNAFAAGNISAGMTSPQMTTGVRTVKNDNEDDALRAAFGLRN